MLNSDTSSRVMMNSNQTPPEALFVTYLSITTLKITIYLIFLSYEKTMAVQTEVIVLKFTRTLIFDFAVLSHIFFLYEHDLCKN